MKIKNKINVLEFFGIAAMTTILITAFVKNETYIEFSSGAFLAFFIIFLIITLIPAQDKPSLKDSVKDKDFWLVMCYDFSDNITGFNSKVTCDPFLSFVAFEKDTVQRITERIKEEYEDMEGLYIYEVFIEK